MKIPLKISLTPYRQRKYEYLAALLLTFIVLLPKGGIKMAGIPLTIGYAILFLFAGISFTAYTYTSRIRWIGKNHFICLAAIFPFFAVSTVKIVGAGFESLGFLFSFYVSLFVIPVIFLLLFYHPIKYVSFEFLKNILIKFVFFTAIYGIFLFFYKLYTGSFIEIPLITVNMGDVGELENKSIDRGGIFKLISTYNNGNIYGVCMMMLLPFYNYYENKTYRKLLLKLALVLTLSRTVWGGLVVFETLNFIFIQKKTLKNVSGVLLTLVLIAFGLLLGLLLLQADVTFVADTSLGGRLWQFAAVSDSDFFPNLNAPFETILEMMYLSILANFGWLGMISFIAYLVMPLFLFISGKTPNNKSIEKQLLALGLVLYLTVAFLDGALLYIPVMPIYWFVALLLLSDFEVSSYSRRHTLQNSEVNRDY